MKKGLLLMLAAASVMMMTGCSGSSSSGEKKGVPLAQVDQKGSDGIAFVNVDGQCVINDSRFSSAIGFSEGLCAVFDKGTNKLGFINGKSDLVIPCQFDNDEFRHRIPSMTNIRERNMFHCGYARVCSGDGYILIDRNGNTVLEGYVPIDWDGHVVIACDQNVREVGLYTMNGKVVVAVGKYSRYRFLQNGMLACYDNESGCYGIIDRNGNVVVNKERGEGFLYDEVSDFADGYALVHLKETDGPWHVIDTKGNVVRQYPKRIGNTLTFNRIPKFYEGLTIYQGGILNNRYDPLLEFSDEVKVATYFSDGMARVYESLNGGAKMGYVNTQGEMVIPYKYNAGSDFSDGVALVQDDSGWHIIDKNDNIVATLPGSVRNANGTNVPNFHAERLVTYDDERQVIYDTKGNEVVLQGVTGNIENFYYSGSDNSEVDDEL
ncbi:MAG: WG repeat-containing protein [Bacteroidales bacterium]|nr:WG repeat-containing protein [Bacteroidales bacterium]